MNVPSVDGPVYQFISPNLANLVLTDETFFTLTFQTWLILAISWMLVEKSFPVGQAYFCLSL